MTHLSPDELIDAVETVLSPDRQGHLAACEVSFAPLAPEHVL